MGAAEDKARWVIASHGVEDIPATALDAIAHRQNIRCRFAAYPDESDLDGLLIVRGDKRAIVVNTLHDNIGKRNFTFAHELGHHFLDHVPRYVQAEGSEFRCTSSDTGNATHPDEIAANRFAVELLMPEDRFRLDMAGAPFDFATLGNLSNQYLVSKLACGFRLVALTSAPCVMVCSRDGAITHTAVSRAARGFPKDLKTIPPTTAAHQAIVNRRGASGFTSGDPAVWQMRYPTAAPLLECTHVHTDSGRAMTLLKW